MEEEGKEEKPEKKEKPKEKEKPADDTEKAELLRKNKELNRALHEERQKGKKKDDEVSLTDDQLLGIMDQYKDDPKTLLNVIKYQAQQAAKGETKKVVDDEVTKAKKAEAETFLYNAFPDLEKDDSELRAAVNKTIQYLGVDNHPLKDLFGTAVEYLRAGPKLMREAYEKGMKDAKAGKVEEKRKEDVKGSTLTPKGSGTDKKGASTPEVQDVANRLGLKTPQQMALLRKLTAGAKGSRSISVEG
jgi:hypothetical protein